MAKTGEIRFFYCCDQKFSTRYRKIMREFKRLGHKCTILTLKEEIVRDFYRLKQTCRICYHQHTRDAILVNITYELPDRSTK